MNKIIFYLLTFLFLNESHAQLSRHIVYFKHKGATTHSITNPAPYLSQRAIERRIRYNISIDSSDLPVPASFILQLQTIPGITILNVSRWLNAVTVQTNDAGSMPAVTALPFVKSSSAVAGRIAVTPKNKLPRETISIPATGSRPQQIASNYFDYGGNSFNEIHLHNGELLHNIGLRGQGLEIAMLDGGFSNYTTLNAFDSVNANGQVLSTWDFVFRHSGVVEDHPHGMQCFSTIAANIPGQFIGKAPKANFHLFKTEDVSSEYPIEEFNWACGAERADSTGADVISSSLGYGYGFTDPVPDYPYTDLNGDITISAKAADLAAKKGLLVFNAAGNSGNDYWRMITTPADGDSVIAVGAVNTSGVIGSFSSYGPSAKGSIKPDVASVGVSAIIQLSNNTLGASNGTSFACPNMAGLASCLWQGFPEFNNMRIARALKEAGSIYTSPDDRIGYGIPDMKKAFTALLVESAVSSATFSNCMAIISWTSRDIGAMKYEIERKAPGDSGYKRITELNPQAGDILSKHSYEFADPLNGLPAGKILYRIRQIIDKDPQSFTAAYIDSVELTINSPCTGIISNRVIVVPNPVIGNSSLVIETDYAIDNMSVLVYDMNGKLVLQLSHSKSAGRISLSLPTTNLNKGQYVIKVMDGNKTVGKTNFLNL